MTLSNQINLINYFSIQDLQGKEFYKKEVDDAKEVDQFIKAYVSNGPFFEIDSTDVPKSSPHNEKNILFKCLTNIVNIVKNIFSCFAKIFKSRDLEKPSTKEESGKNESNHPLVNFIQIETDSKDVNEVKMFKLIIEFNSLGEEEIISESIRKSTKNIDRACLYIPTQGSDRINFTIRRDFESYTKVVGVKEATLTLGFLSDFNAKSPRDFNAWLSTFVKV